ncbi:CAP domain-containing protein [Paracoccus caeni]|uniref:CAP domain-containing protein n=1 Tax=Paracoccus caeni TaxID=657651 RepID=A0A934SCB0_9RHOB|nr:CAP domain-containing protein [Paracoccus caeni]MBK4216216.1 CAP domain-containing protein [Paracoccus caeni]
MTSLRLSALAFVSVLAACAQEGGQSPSGSDPHDVQATAPGQATCLRTTHSQNQAGAAATNAMRARSGLPPVRPNPTLSRVAAEHACDMAQRGRMTHRGSSSAGPGPRVKAAGYAPSITAENIAAGPFDQGRVLSEWNRSSGHVANLLIPQMRDYGIGQAIGADGRTRFWSAVYAAPRQ